MSDTDFSWGRLRGLFALSHDGIDWQHDVDYSPACALEMAKFEHELGIQATYFIRPRSDEYNPFGPGPSSVLGGIVAFGHRLGVHVDLGFPRTATISDNLLGACCETQHRILSALYAISDSLSFHAPPASVLGRDVAGFKSVHSPYWQERWIGDSRGVWQENPEARIAAGEELRVNLHPEWWFWPRELADEWREREAAKP